MTGLWSVTPCSLVVSYQCFGVTFCLHLWGTSYSSVKKEAGCLFECWYFINRPKRQHTPKLNGRRHENLRFEVKGITLQLPQFNIAYCFIVSPRHVYLGPRSYRGVKDTSRETVNPSRSHDHSFIHSFSSLSDDRSKASSKTIPPHSAI